jgi:hypothetical protein
MFSSSSGRFSLIPTDAEGTERGNMTITHILRGMKDYGTSYQQKEKKNMNKSGKNCKIMVIRSKALFSLQDIWAPDLTLFSI